MRVGQRWCAQWSGRFGLPDFCSAIARGLLSGWNSRRTRRDMSLFAPDFFVLAAAVVDAPKSKGFLDALQSMLATAKDPWVDVGLVGSFVFSVRFVIQWVASERAKKSVIPFGFWECSAFGAVLVLSLFHSSEKSERDSTKSAAVADLHSQPLLALHAQGAEAPGKYSRARGVGRTALGLIRAIAPRP